MEHWPEVFVLTWGIRSSCLSAEERSCLEGVYTVRRPERWAGDESEKFNRLLTVCSLFWLGLVTSKEFEEEVAHNNVCVL